MRADDRLAGGELDEFITLPMIEAVRPGVGIEDPVFLDAVLLIGGELRSDIAIRRPRRECFRDQSGGEGRMAFRQSARLLPGVVLGAASKTESLDKVCEEVCEEVQGSDAVALEC